MNPKFRKVLKIRQQISILQAYWGEQYISQDAGGGEDYLQDGGQIEITQSAVVLEQVIGQMLYDKAAGEMTNMRV